MLHPARNRNCFAHEQGGYQNGRNNEQNGHRQCAEDRGPPGGEFSRQPVVHGIEKNHQNGGPTQRGEERFVDTKDEINEQQQNAIGKKSGQAVTGGRVRGRSRIVSHHIILIGWTEADKFRSALRQVVRGSSSQSSMSTKSTPLNSYQIRLLAVL